MAVDVCGHLDVRVSQPLLHVLQAVALRQKHAGAGVAQVVESDVGQVVLLQQLVEGVAHIVGGVGVPVLPGEYVVVVYVVLAEVVAVVLFLLKQDLEQPYRIVCQGKAAEAGCVFRLVLLHDLRDPGHGVPYGQRLHRKVDALMLSIWLVTDCAMPVQAVDTESDTPDHAVWASASTPDHALEVSVFI